MRLSEGGGKRPKHNSGTLRLKLLAGVVVYRQFVFGAYPIAAKSNEIIIC